MSGRRCRVRSVRPSGLEGLPGVASASARTPCWASATPSMLDRRLASFTTPQSGREVAAECACLHEQGVQGSAPGGGARLAYGEGRAAVKNRLVRVALGLAAALVLSAGLAQGASAHAKGSKHRGSAPRHIFVIMMENHGTPEIIGNTSDA